MTPTALSEAIKITGPAANLLLLSATADVIDASGMGPGGSLTLASVASAAVAVTGSSGNDILIASAGSDIIVAGAGDDTVAGGLGADAIDFSGGGKDIVALSGITSGLDGDIVNGTIVRRGGRDAVAADGALPGALLRNGRAR